MVRGWQWNLYKETLLGVGGFLFHLSLLVLMNSKTSYNIETASICVLSRNSRYEFQATFVLV
jgi:hypothetical protein